MDESVLKTHQVLGSVPFAFYLGQLWGGSECIFRPSGRGAEGVYGGESAHGAALWSLLRVPHCAVCHLGRVGGAKAGCARPGATAPVGVHTVDRRGLEGGGVGYPRSRSGGSEEEQRGNWRKCQGQH